MRNTIPSIPGLLVLRCLIIAIGIIARAVNDRKQRCLRQCREEYLIEENAERFYWNKLENEYHSIKHTEDFVQRHTAEEEISRTTLPVQLGGDR